MYKVPDKEFIKAALSEFGLILPDAAARGEWRGVRLKKSQKHQLVLRGNRCLALTGCEL